MEGFCIHPHKGVLVYQVPGEGLYGYRCFGIIYLQLEEDNVYWDKEKSEALKY